MRARPAFAVLCWAIADLQSSWLTRAVVVDASALSLSAMPPRKRLNMGNLGKRAKRNNSPSPVNAGATVAVLDAEELAMSGDDEATMAAAAADDEAASDSSEETCSSDDDDDEDFEDDAAVPGVGAKITRWAQRVFEAGSK